MTNADQARVILKQATQDISRAIALLEEPQATDEAQHVQPTEQTKSIFESAAFYDTVRQDIFGGSLTRSQVEGLRRIGSTCERAGLPIEQAAYVLASVYHETGGRMQPVRETFADTDDQAIRRLGNAWTSGKLPWVKTPYWRKDGNGRSWFGRGDIQLTHEDNYRKQQAKLSDHHLRATSVPYQVHDNPEVALYPQTSALIAVLGMRDGDFTGKKLSDYIQPGKADYLNARRIVNGTDRAAQIAGYARHFEGAIRASA